MRGQTKEYSGCLKVCASRWYSTELVEQDDVEENDHPARLRVQAEPQ